MNMNNDKLFSFAFSGICTHCNTNLSTRIQSTIEELQSSYFVTCPNCGEDALIYIQGNE